METKAWAIMFVVVCTLLTSTAQIFYKLGADKLEFRFIKIITNYYLIGGLAIYGIAVVILLIALKGGELSVLYPIIATSYIWVSLLSVYFFNEVMNLYKWVGISLIIGGIVLINLGSKKGEVIGYTEAV
jgi:multidrug transporter EmrE-like cation transporter